MLVVKYYRLYLWIYLGFFLLLFSIALIWDICESISTSSVKYPRFVGTLISCIFSSGSIYLFHTMAEKKFNIALYKTDKTEWKSSFIVDSKFNHRKARFDKKLNIFGLNFGFNFLNLAPLILVALLVTASASIGNHISLSFVSVAVLLRYIAWYITFFGFMGSFVINKDKNISYLSD